MAGWWPRQVRALGCWCACLGWAVCLELASSQRGEQRASTTFFVSWACVLSCSGDFWLYILDAWRHALLMILMLVLLGSWRSDLLM
jgi:hypothetical protein